MDFNGPAALKWQPALTSLLCEAFVARNENARCMAENQLAAQKRMGRACSMADALYRLEFHMACH